MFLQYHRDYCKLCSMKKIHESTNFETQLCMHLLFIIFFMVKSPNLCSVFLILLTAQCFLSHWLNTQICKSGNLGLSVILKYTLTCGGGSRNQIDNHPIGRWRLSPPWSPHPLALGKWSSSQMDIIQEQNFSVDIEKPLMQWENLKLESRKLVQSTLIWVQK